MLTFKQFLLNEEIDEASIFTRPERYSYGHKVKIAGSSDKGKSLLKAIQQVIPDFDAGEELEWVKNAPKTAPLIQFGKGDTIRNFKRSDGTFMMIAGTDNAIQSGLVHAAGQKGSTERNVGDIAEPVLSAAVVAKLINRVRGEVKDITIDDIRKVLDDVILHGKTTYNRKDKDSDIADKITFTLAVREPTKKFMETPEYWDYIVSKGIAQSAMHYANIGQIDRYAEYFYKNGKVDEIRVQSDGLSDQKSRKTDITATVNGRDLKNLQLSLKAGHTQFGSQGAGIVTTDPKNIKGVYQSSVNFFGPLGIKLTPPTKTPESKIDWWKTAYDQAAAQLTKALAGKNAKSEAGVIVKLADMIVDHATKGDPSVRLVKLSKKGVSTVHSFRGLVQKLISDDIDLTVEYRIGKSTGGEPRPEINIKDSNSGKSLVKLGYHATTDNTKIWNSIQMEPLLSELTTVK